jgi:hypothetical protein
MGGAAPSRSQAKLTVPLTGDGVPERPRLTTKVHVALAGPGSVLVVNASAGAGKTTAIRHALAHQDHPVAWLTLDRFDVSPGRWLTHLESALQSAGGLPAPVVAPALTRGRTGRRGPGHRDLPGLRSERWPTSRPHPAESTRRLLEQLRL